MVGVGNDQFAIVDAADRRLRRRPAHPSAGRRARADDSRRRRARATSSTASSCVPLALDRRADRRATSRGAPSATAGPSPSFSTTGRFAEPAGFWVGGERETRRRARAGRRRGVGVADAAQRAGRQHRHAGVRRTAGSDRADGRARSGASRCRSTRRAIRARPHPIAPPGFRPSERDPNSRDTRLLGVYVDRECADERQPASKPSQNRATPPK